MDNELAKQLKDAGFPVQSACGHCGYDAEYFKPTHSELIEACGDKFEALLRWGKNTWGAYSIDRTIKTQGSTPEEAVAKLWLALNEHKHQWIDARNEVVESGEMCLCGAIRALNKK